MKKLIQHINNEIIKTLQEMADYPHNYEEGQDLQNALDLINLLQAENERLEKVVEYKQGIIDVLFTDNAKLLGKQSEIQITAATNILRDMELTLETAKAEAYKECIEKVKAISPLRFNVEHTEYYDKPSIDKMVLFIDDNDLDNLLKELVGE